MIDSLKVIDNILFSLKLNKKNIINEAEIKQIISSLGIEELLDKYPLNVQGVNSSELQLLVHLYVSQKFFLLMSRQGT